LLPQEIVSRFQTISLDRIARLEASWGKLVADPSDAESVSLIHREVHTLKGDSRMVGFTDVDLVCHKLEDLLELARDRGYQVSEDFELSVTMGLQLVGMLIRKRVGTSLAGIDLPGFVRQIDALVAETRRDKVPRARVITANQTRLRPAGLAATVRKTLATTALELFLEHHGGTALTKRVQRGWYTLRDLLALPAPSVLAPLLAKHEAGALELAAALRKPVDVTLAIDDIRADPAICAALEVAALHLIRNAIDHGIESARGTKPARGAIVVAARLVDEQIRLEISDDGRGIDFFEVRHRAVTLGRLAADAQVSEEQLAALLFQPGFSTRTVATDVSGRGMGLDAVGAAVAAVGGTVTVDSALGQGTRWIVTVPAPSRRFAATSFAVPGSTLRFAIATDWQVDVVTGSHDSLDLVELLGLGTPPLATAMTLRCTRDDTTVYFAASRPGVAAQVLRLISMPPHAAAEVVAIDGVEGLLLRPELLVQSTGRVAILDDSEICRELVKCSLEPIGIAVQMLEDPAQLIAALTARPVDLLLLDLSFRGIELADLVKRVHAALPDALVYLYSDRPPPELARIAETIHADGFISKRVGADQFVVRINRVLRARR
jgi:two-component system chemotaxis sensor kinase CheA